MASATGPTAHMVFLAILFVASVVLAGVTLRDLAGERAGILGALVFATFPLLWVNPATVGPETDRDRRHHAAPLRRRALLGPTHQRPRRPGRPGASGSAP